jgi:hypothetical protein
MRDAQEGGRELAEQARDIAESLRASASDAPGVGHRIEGARQATAGRPGTTGEGARYAGPAIA